LYACEAVFLKEHFNGPCNVMLILLLIVISSFFRRNVLRAVQGRLSMHQTLELPRKPIIDSIDLLSVLQERKRPLQHCQSSKKSDCYVVRLRSRQWTPRRCKWVMDMGTLLFFFFTFTSRGFLAKPDSSPLFQTLTGPPAHPKIDG
jgi:hypothetical protein